MRDCDEGIEGVEGVRNGHDDQNDGELPITHEKVHICPWLVTDVCTSLIHCAMLGEKQTVPI